MSKRRRESFADLVARMRLTPARPAEVPVGRRGDVWGDPVGMPYALIEGELSSSAAFDLAARGARVVYDSCGCGGVECALDWLAPDEVRDLVQARAHPVRGTGQRADIEHWRSPTGDDLIVLAVDVVWSDRISS